MIRTYKFRIYPKAVQEETLRQWQIACWEVQRLCVIQRRIVDRQRSLAIDSRHLPDGRLVSNRRIVGTFSTKPTWVSQAAEITELRREYPYLATVPADVMAVMASRVDSAYQRMWQDRKKGKRAHVRWADRASDIGLEFRGNRGTVIEQVNSRWARIRLAGASKLGWLRVRMHRQLPEGYEMRIVHLVCQVDGWYVSLVCTIPDRVVSAPVAKYDVVGVDLGCLTDSKQRQRVAIADNGRIFKTTNQLTQNKKRLAIYQKLISNRKTRGAAVHADPNSKRTQRRIKRVAQLHARIARQRNHTLQYVARRFADTATTTVFEDIDWTALRQKGKGGRKRGLNRSMTTASPAKLVQLTQQKAEERGRSIAKVSARYTSQDCSECGHRSGHKDLGVRLWTCSHCGSEHDRDVNAARNIKQRFMPDA